MTIKRTLKEMAVYYTLLALLAAWYIWDVKQQQTVSIPVDTTPSTLRIAKPTDTIQIPAHLNPKDVIRLTNEYRATKNLPALKENSLLNQSACAKAQHMVDNNYWGHVAPDGTEPWYFFKGVGYAYRNAGENLGYSQKTSIEIVNGWIGSPKHQENLVGDYMETGVCVLTRVTYQNKMNTSLTVAHYATLK